MTRRSSKALWPQRSAQSRLTLIYLSRTRGCHRVFESVRREADRLGVGIRDSEIIGLVPAAVLASVATRQLQLAGFTMDQILECRLDR